MIKLSTLKLNKKNPRKISDDRMAKLISSIEAFPKMMELRPIVIDEKNVILGGNMRYQALVSLGKKEVPNSWIKRAAKLSPDERRRFVVEDNLGFGEWDVDSLAAWDLADLEEWGTPAELIAKISEEQGVTDYSEWEAESDALAGMEDESITIVVPAKYKERVVEFLSNGNTKTGPGIGKGVLQLCGLL